MSTLSRSIIPGNTPLVCRGSYYYSYSYYYDYHYHCDDYYYDCYYHYYYAYSACYMIKHLFILNNQHPAT